MMFSVYPKMKDSEVAWVSPVPQEWDIVPNRYVFGFIKRAVGEHADKFVLLSLTLQGVIPRDTESGKGKYPESFDTYQAVDPGDLIFCLFDIDETPRTVGLSYRNGMVTGAYDVAKCREGVSPNYVYYYYLSLDFFKRLRPLYTGLRKVIRPNTFLSAKMPLPSYPEQKSIASFLDGKTALIDDLIAKRERQIELLHEQRTALITRAVTKGLNTNVTMKDSGVDWLGEVPEHWVVIRMGLLEQSGSDFVSGPFGSSLGSNDYMPEGIPVIRGLNTTLNAEARFVAENFVYVGEDKFKELYRCSATPGDLIFTARGTVGKVGIVPKEIPVALISPNQLRFRPDVHKHNADYLFYLFSSSGLQQNTALIADSVAQPNLNLGSLKSISIPLPPIAEQNAIATYLDYETTKIDAFATKVQQSIEKLNEYRQSLISATVTGKIDVRNCQSSSDPSEETLHA